MKYAKSWICTPFLNFERASIPSVNVLVLCICWMLCLFTKVYATLRNAFWSRLKSGLWTCHVFNTCSYAFDLFSNAGLHASCCGSRILSTLSFLPRTFSCIMGMAQGKNDAMLIISCIFVCFIGQCCSAWKTVIKVMLSLQDGVVECTFARGECVILNMATEIIDVIKVWPRRPRWVWDD